LDRNRWFFIKISGRRRIGKTTLVNRVINTKIPENKRLYMQIPDSDPAGVLSEARDFYSLFNIPISPPNDLKTLAKSLGELIRLGYVVAMMNFSIFTGKPCSSLPPCCNTRGSTLGPVGKHPGWFDRSRIVHTEMVAI
jgi:hypothetical protein